jgi:membrane-bound acyltransferase YfiQ involved in biofilm formation
MHFVNVASSTENNVAEPHAFISTILILGYAAIILNAMANFINAYLLFKKINQPTPKWLVIANFIFLLAEIAYFSLT